MSLFSTLGIGRSGLRAASIGIETTSHNVANAGVEGFHRRSIEQANPTSRFSGNLMLGQGVNVTRIRRATDQFLGFRMVEQAGTAAHASTLASVLGNVEQWFNEANNKGVNQVVEELYDAFSASTGDPSDHGLRQSLSQAASLTAETVARTAKGLDDTISDLEAQLETNVEHVNMLIVKLSAVNEAINSSGDSLGAGDLLDDRDRLAKEISSIIGAKVSFADSGQASIYVGGHAMVSGTDYREISLSEDANGDPVLLMETSKGHVDVTADAKGIIGGTMEARTTTQSYLEKLNTFASEFADAINAQNASGFDMSGNVGGAVFSYSAGSEALSMQFSSSIMEDDTLWAFAGAATAEAGDDVNLQAFIDLEGSNIFSSGTESSGEYLGSLLNSVAADTVRAQAEAEQATNTSNDIEGLMASMTGVDLDQEATGLIEFQAAYQASAKVIQAADQMLQTLLTSI